MLTHSNIPCSPTSTPRSLLPAENFSLRKVWNIAHDEVLMGKELGRGAFGAVFKGLWRDIPVAVKVFQSNELFPY
jgi:hypothetical protein